MSTMLGTGRLYERSGDTAKLRRPSQQPPEDGGNSTVGPEKPKRRGTANREIKQKVFMPYNRPKDIGWHG